MEPPIDEPGSSTPRSESWDPGQTTQRLASLRGSAAGGGASGAPDRRSPERTRLLARRVVELEVRIDHPAYLPVRTRVRVDAATALQLPPIAVTRAAVVGGRIVDDQARPVASAQVGAFETSGDVPMGEAVDRTVTGADGAFRLRLRDGVPTAVVAAVAGQRPALDRVVGSLGSAMEISPLELRAGGLVSGTVRDARGAPVVEGAVGVFVRAHEAMLFLPPHVLACQRDGSIDHRSARARILPDGTFELPGLGPGPYRVTPSALGMTGDLQASLERPALPLARDVDFRVTGGEVRLEVRSGGTPIAGAELRIIGGERITPRTTDLHGDVHFLGFPGREYEVGVKAAGFETRTLSVTAPEEGASRTEPIDLRSLPSTASWTVTLRPPDGGTVPVAGFGFFAADSHGPTAVPLFTRDVASTDGVFQLAGLEAGRYRAVIRPGAGWADPGSFYSEIATELSLAENSHPTADYVLRPAGRLRIGARGPDGAFLPALCTLRDVQGQTLEVAIVHRGVGTLLRYTSLLSADGPADVYPALAPGTYDVEVSLRGCRTVRTTVAIRAGVATEASVPLSAE